MSSTVLQVKPGVTAGLTLRAQLVWTLAGTSFYTASQWAVLVALAKFGTPAMVGELALGLAISAPIFLFATLRLRTIQGTDAGGEYITGDYLSLRAVTTLFALLVLLGIVLFGPYNRETQLVILGVGVSKAYECGSDVLCGLFQQY